MTFKTPTIALLATCALAACTSDIEDDTVDYGGYEDLATYEQALAECVAPLVIDPQSFVCEYRLAGVDLDSTLIISTDTGEAFCQVFCDCLWEPKAQPTCNPGEPASGDGYNFPACGSKTTDGGFAGSIAVPNDLEPTEACAAVADQHHFACAQSCANQQAPRVDTGLVCCVAESDPIVPEPTLIPGAHKSPTTTCPRGQICIDGTRR